MSEAEITPSLQLNTRGLRCPEPVMMLHQAIRKSKAGDVVEVFATDNSTSWDIQNSVCISAMNCCFKKNVWMKMAIKSSIIW